jgi:prepilin-type N-terminal cleavage/methylation domain-containing protein
MSSISKSQVQQQGADLLVLSDLTVPAPSIEPSVRTRRGFTFFEVIVTLVLAAILAVVAIPVYKWAFSESADRLAKIDAMTFERNVRALANTELRSPSNSDISTVIDSMTGIDEDLSITVAGDGFEIARNGQTYCVIIGEAPNEKGSITAGSCD